MVSSLKSGGSSNLLKRTLQNSSKFSKRSLKHQEPFGWFGFLGALKMLKPNKSILMERNPAILEAADSENRFIQTSLKVLVVIAVLCFILMIISFKYKPKLLDEETFFASVEVGGIVGFDVNATALMFGMVTSGGSSMRKMIFDNDYDSDVLIEFIGEGDFANFFQNKIIKIGKGEIGREINLNAYAPSGTKYGIYDGSVNVKIFEYIG